VPVAIACLLIGGVIGFFIGVSSVHEARGVLTGMFHAEQKAGTETPVVLERTSFRLQTPGNWKVDTTDPDYDADHMFSIDSPGQSFAMFQVLEGAVDPKAIVEKQVDAQTSRVVKEATQTPFDKWGRYAGEGVLLKGKLLGTVPGEIRIFAFREGSQTFSIVETTYDEDRSSVQPGFELIERSFEVKTP